MNWGRVPENAVSQLPPLDMDVAYCRSLILSRMASIWVAFAIATVYGVMARQVLSHGRDAGMLLWFAFLAIAYGVKAILMQIKPMRRVIAYRKGQR